MILHLYIPPGHQGQVAVSEISFQTGSPLLPIIIGVLHLNIIFLQEWQWAVVLNYVEVLPKVDSRYLKTHPQKDFNWG